MVKVEKMSLYYTKKEEVLDNISFGIEKGQCLLFTGESGSGKSSIINTINSLALRYDDAIVEGSIKICGEETTNMKLYEISMLVSSVFQNPKTHFFNINTTLELLFYLENIGLSRDNMEKRMEEMLELFPIEYLLNRDIFKLSGGEKQILCVAASYIAGTEIIVLDEPSSSLDNIYTDILSKMISILKKKKITIIISEHRIYYLMDIIDKVFIIKNGKIKSKYSREEFLKIKSEDLNSMGIRDKIKVELMIRKADNCGEFEIRNLEFKFNGEEDKLKINNLNLSIGRIYGIIGKNGCGKSTFIRSLIGVEKKSREEIYLYGKKLSKKNRLKKSSIVMQDVNNQLFTDSVINEMKLGIKDIEEDKLEEILKNLNLYHLKNSHPMSLSGGQKQRVAIASAICKNSSFLFFDEPTSGMDFANMVKISNLIKSCKEDNKIIFIISHDTEFLNITVDNIINIEDYRFIN